jgi:hypothetical protein
MKPTSTDQKFKTLTINAIKAIAKKVFGRIVRPPKKKLAERRSGMNTNINAKIGMVKKPSMFDMTATTKKVFQDRLKLATEIVPIGLNAKSEYAYQCHAWQ